MVGFKCTGVDYHIISYIEEDFWTSARESRIETKINEELYQFYKSSNITL